MFRWLRLLISVLALLAVMAGGTGGATAASTHHHDCALMAMDDSPCEGDMGVLPPCHDSMLCAGLQILPPPHFSILDRVVELRFVSQVEGFSRPSGLRPTPDLRPPIA
jgi:hypothetical protein